MASNQEMFTFISNFGPMLGELAAHVEYLERRVEALEGGAIAAAPGGAPGAPTEDPEAVFEFMGHKFDMREMLEKGMPSGGAAGLMERIKNWRPGAGAPTPPTPTPATPASSAVEPPKG